MVDEYRKKLELKLSEFGRYDHWANALLLFVLTLSRSWLNEIPTSFLWGFTFIAGLWALYSETAKRDSDRLRAIDQIELDLYLLRLSVEKHGNEGSNVRANVMLFGRQNNGLRIYWYDRIEFSTELQLVWKAGQGCAGQAFLRGDPVVADLGVFKANTFEELVGDDGQAPWGLTKEHWLYTQYLGSVLSYPIPSPIRPSKVIGILNIDSLLPLEESRLGDQRVLDLVDEYIGVIANSIVQSGVFGKGEFK